MIHPFLCTASSLAVTLHASRAHSLFFPATAQHLLSNLKLMDLNDDWNNNDNTCEEEQEQDVVALAYESKR